MTLARDPQEYVDDGSRTHTSLRCETSPRHGRRAAAAILVAAIASTLSAASPTVAGACDPFSDPGCGDGSHSGDPYYSDPYYSDPYYGDPVRSTIPVAIRTGIPSATAPAGDALASPDDLADLHRSIAGRLVLAVDALFELGAFSRDEDPGLNLAIADVAHTVPSAGLDDDGYRRELATLASDFPGLLDQLGVAPSESLQLVLADVDGDFVSRLEAGDVAFVEALPWLESIADVLRRGGAPLIDETEAEFIADEDAVFDFVELFSDPALFENPEPEDEYQVVTSTSTTTPDLALIDARATAAEGSPTDDTPAALLAGIAAALMAALAGLAVALSRRRSGDDATTGGSHDEVEHSTMASQQPTTMVTLPIAPPREEPGSLVELLDASRRMTASLDTEEIAAIAVTEARNLVKAEGGLLLRRSADALVPLASDPRELFSSDDLESSVLRRVVDTGRTVSSVTSEDPALVEVPAAMAAVAIVANGSVIGALMVVRRPTRQFSPAELDALEMLAPLVGSALLAAQTHGSATALADLDALTGLANRRSLDRDIGALRSTHIASYVMIDVDHFKNFNDTNGHAAGDLALQTVARAIEANVRPEDRVYRYGGEEFCVLLPGASSASAAHVAERVRAAVEASTIPGGEHQPGGRVTISIGVADTEAGIADIIERADGALYVAKETGRNRVNISGSTAD